MTHLLHELQNADNLESINEIQFSLFSHQDIKRGSVADILTPDTYDANIPKNNGLFDHNMGSIDASIICPIDEKKAELCPGYFGKIDLALPVFNHHFITYIEKILKCVCFRCSNLLLDKSDPHVLKELEGKKGYNRFISCIALSIKNKKCSFNNGCFVLQPTKYVRLNGAASIKDKNNIIQIYAEFSQNAFSDNKVLKHQNFTPLICYQILKKIKDEDVNFLGLSSIYSRPEWMIITSLAVPPPSVRPSVRQSDNQRSEDDLTYALLNIIKSNKLLKQVLDNGNSNSKKVDDHQGYLQYLISTYMDNEIPGVPPNAQRSTFRALKAITQRLKGKEGRLRGNIMGKRVDYSARTVISVDPNINIDEYGVPQKIAMNLTFPEIITIFNIKKMRETVKNGPKTYPGAKTVTKTGEGLHKNISLKHVDVQQIADNLEVGDIVHRHLIDGDVCLFNRQPTLHRMSMMSHKIKILPFSTFRLNVTVCKPYNADFDGDEMNMHIPQSLQTFTELEQICLVPQHIISPGTSIPCMSIEQDTLLGGYLLTIQDIRLRKDQMNNYMMFTDKYNGKLPAPAGIEYGNPYWTGKQLYSLILPDISINQLKNVKVIRGEITEGYLNSESLGNSSSGLIKQIYNAYGMERCTDFLNDTQKLITRWMVDNSFTIGFGDSILLKDQRSVIKEITNKYLNDTFDLIKKAQHGVFANDLDDAYKSDKLEFEISEILSNLTEKVKDYIFGNISKQNNFFISGKKGAGSKGDLLHTTQTLGIVGQQQIWGSRIENGFTDRTLPHFPRNDVGPDAKGFCRNSFIEGLTPSEMFFHAMGGRTGTIDTAIKSVTGDTVIIIMEEGIMKKVQIGIWIDNLLDLNKENVQNLPEKEMELLQLNYTAHIPTTDLDGNVSWGLIKNITRHDPGKELYEIKTKGGRNVIVTESHSLLIWNGSQYERKSTPEVRIGDYVPVTLELSEPPCVNKDFDLESDLDHIDYKKGLNPAIFNAPLSIIKKFIGNVFSKNGRINKESIQLRSSSYPFINDLNICLSRLGIFGVVYPGKINRLSIKNKWATIFKDSITINNKIKNDKLQKICPKNNDEFKEINNTILDSIIEINKVDIVKYPKVYDLTIPSTLNFGLANGLHVVDTADSGYLSRKFIKAAEELMVNYDFTVRNSSNHIIQFGYGDDNFDPIKLEKITRIELIEYDNKKMEDVYKFDTLDDPSYFENFMTPSAVKEMMEDMNYRNILNDEYNEMMQLRDDLRYKYFNNVEAIGDVNTYIPINLFRIIPSQLIKFNIQSFQLSDLTPEYIISTYNKTMKDIIKYLPEKEDNWKLFKVIFKSFLSTKRIIKEYRMTKAAYDSIILLIREKMMSALINPGEMVGIIGAQTLGEISTQLTLNSVIYETEILVRNTNKKIVKIQIGKFIEDQILKTDDLQYMKDKDTTYAGCADYYEIQSCTEDGEVLWKRIEAVTKHPVINKDGTNTMLKITTEDEREVVATKAKSFLKLVNGKIVDVDGDSLKVGDYLPISNKVIDFRKSTLLNFSDILQQHEYLPRNHQVLKNTTINNFVYLEQSNNMFDYIELNYDFGYLIGAYLVDSFLSTNEIIIIKNSLHYYKPIIKLCKKLNIYTKIINGQLKIFNLALSKIVYKLCGKPNEIKFISDKIIFSNNECLKGLFASYIGPYYSNIILKDYSKKILEDFSIILNILNIHSYLSNVDDIYLLNITESITELIPNEIDGKIIYEKRNLRFVDAYFVKIKSIEEVNNTTDYAYDLTVKDTRNFNISNFLMMRDTFHLAGTGAGSLVITNGIPRLRELINISKNPKNKNMIIYLNKENSLNKDNAKKIQSRFAYTQLKDILSKSEILYDNKYGITDKNEDYEFIKSYKEFTTLFDIDNIDESCLSPWILRLVFDKESLMNRKITIQEIQETIKENFHNDQEIDCIYSDDSVNDVVMRIRIKQDSKGTFLEFMKDFEKQLIGLPLRGIANIRQVELSESNIILYVEDGSIVPSKEWILKTNGSNLLDILGDDAVDVKRTITNDILEFYEIFGIEATRELLYRELYKVYSEKNPNLRHIQMLSDIMTYRGKLMPIDRHGLNKNSEIGPIAKASFEEVMNIFTKAALFAEKDNMKGVSSNIFAGQFCKSGTNCFDILIDEDKLMEKIDILGYDEDTYVDIKENDIEKAFDNAYDDYEQTDDVKDSDFNFGFGIEEKEEYSLDKIETSNIVIADKEIEPSTDEINYNKIKIEEGELLDNLDIDFEKIEIEEPDYNPPEIKKEVTSKKVKITKKKTIIKNEK